MKLLITLKLLDQAVLSHLKPISKIKEIEKIYVVRDKKGIDIPKVEYISVPKLFRFPILRVLAKRYLLVKHGLKINPNLIHSYYLVPHGLNAIYAGKKLGKKIGVSLVGTDLNERIKKGKYSKYLLNQLKKAHFVTVTGSSSKRYLKTKGIKKIYILPNSADTKRFSTKKIKKIYDIIFVGRLVEVKRVDILLKALAIVKKTNNFKAAILGDGLLKEKLQKLCIGLGLKDNVEFLGFKENIEYFYQKSKIFIMTSASEGLPLSLIEAMCCGLVPIIPNVGDITDVAINGKNALVVKSLDVKEFAEAILKLLNNKALYSKLSKNALLVKQNYSEENVKKFWESIIKKLNN